MASQFGFVLFNIVSVFNKKSSGLLYKLCVLYVLIFHDSITSDAANATSVTSYMKIDQYQLINPDVLCVRAQKR